MLTRNPEILIIPSWYPSTEYPYQGIFLREQARCLARKLPVAVLTPRFPSFKDQLRLRWGPRLLQEVDQGVATWQIRHCKIPTLRRWIPLLNDPDHVLVYYRKFAAAIRRGFAEYVAQQGLPAVIHAHVILPAGWIALELGREFDIPVILTEHSGPFSVHLQTETQRALVRNILLGADQVIAVSPALREAMQAFCPATSIEVIGNTVDTDYFIPDLHASASKNTFRFFFLGVLLENKGVQYLLQAVRLLGERVYRQVEIWIGGDGPLRSPLEIMARELGIASQCRFLGMLNRSQVREQLQACDVFVLPSLGETFGIVLAEAMACGKPVLSTRCGGPQYVVTPETGVLVAPGNADELAAAMAGFINRRFPLDSGRIRESVVERFSAAVFIEKYASLYQTCLQQACLQGGTSRRVSQVG